MLFSRPFKDIDKTDIEELIALKHPESDKVEYKGSVPGKSAPDKWHADQSSGIGDYARDKLLAEIVAFANTHGGHLIVGIEESADKLKRAESIRHIPACADLAERISQSASACIEPSINNLQVRGIVFADDGSGVVVVRVPQSRNAPHRLKGILQCYTRRGDRTESLTMREIQDLTLNTIRGLSWFEQRMEEFKNSFEKRVFNASVMKGYVGIRCSLVPLIEIGLARSDIESLAISTPAVFKVIHQSNEKRDISPPVDCYSSKPILRGVSFYNTSPRHTYDHELYVDGSQTLSYITSSSITDTTNASVRYVDIVGAAASVLRRGRNLAVRAENPNCEFGLVVQLAFHNAPAILKLNLQIQEGLTTSNFILPAYSYVPEFGLTPILNLLAGDLTNAIGFDYRDPIIDVQSY